MISWLDELVTTTWTRGEVRHGCSDYCRDEAAAVLRGRQIAEEHIPVPPLLPMRRHLPVGVRHVCGPWCMPPDEGGPVVQGRRDPVTSAPLEPLSPGRPQ